MSKGRVYIVRNPLFPTLFKIGFTTKSTVEERGLNSSNVPEAFETIREYECDDCEGMEALFHDTFEHYRYYSQLDKRGKRTEFFSVACLSNAVAWIDRLKGLTDITLKAEEEIETAEEMEENANKGEFDKTKVVVKRRAPHASFSLLKIPIGEELVFVHDDIACKIIDDKHVEYCGEAYTLTSLAYKLLEETGHPQGDNTCVNGWWYFKYGNEILGERRVRIERDNSVCEDAD